MATIKTPKTLPVCDLIEVLADRANERDDIEFDFIGELNRFCTRVKQEIRFINQLFPEYTPHDEEYHIRNLFHIAGLVLSRDRLEAMYSAELFILAVSLYGHDWGMAVSEVEKQFILNNEIPEGINKNELWTLTDEHERVSSFAKKNNIENLLENNPDEISPDLWAEYIRLTHADRSGERVRRYFEPIDGGIAEATSRVCIGHWLDFEKLDNAQLFPTNFSVLREEVNLRAIAVYLRLIDLLDLGEDRTPYVIWKYVAPRNPFSKMDWKKHRTLRPITTPSYQEGRIIMVDGSTDDHEVYSALEDMRIWCNEQLRGSNDILARMNDPRHQLDIYHIKWRVAPRGFQPILFRFEFDRVQMFNILSEEIYQSNPYVFLRELLQNSIDAIRTRRQVHIRKGGESEIPGLIRVNIELEDTGGMIISWEDNGIGMDEYIIRNYLAVAGKSYYQSKEFENEDFDMDPISQFGIGILSCFMVSDYIEIETYKDPYLSPPSLPLKITIPSVERNFRVEVCSPDALSFGTVIRVFINRNVIQSYEDKLPKGHLDVTRYLKSIAGFVEFPIEINDVDNKTVILHPFQDKVQAQNRFGDEYQIHQFNIKYPWESVIPPQDQSIAKEVIQIKSIDISNIQFLEDFEGVFKYLVPIDDNYDLISQFGSDKNSFKPVKRGESDLETPTFRIVNSGSDSPDEREIYINERNNAVFRDGILLSKESLHLDRLPGGFKYQISRFGTTLSVLNLPIKETPKIDISRSQSLIYRDSWTSKFVNAYNKNLFCIRLDELKSFEPTERLYQIGRLLSYEKLNLDYFFNHFPLELTPLPYLASKGRLVIKELNNLLPEILFENIAIKSEYGELFYNFWISQTEYSGCLNFWEGDESIIVRGYFDQYNQEYNYPTLAIESLIDFCGKFISRNYDFLGVRFLENPFKEFTPLFQKILTKRETHKIEQDISRIQEKVIFDTNSVEFSDVYNFSLQYSKLYKFPNFSVFSKPFESHFAYGWIYLNWTHQISKQLLKIFCGIQYAKKRIGKIDEDLGKLEDSVNGIVPDNGIYFGSNIFRHLEFNFEYFKTSLENIWERAQILSVFGINDIENLELNINDFVPGTIGNIPQDFVPSMSDSEKEYIVQSFEINPRFSEITKTFGKVIE